MLRAKDGGWMVAGVGGRELGSGTLEVAIWSAVEKVLEVPDAAA
jgi:hypothetical protein